MPLPFLVLAGVAGVTGLFGAAAHSVANDTNEEAENIAKKAKRKYTTNYNKLEKRSQWMQSSLEELGKTKEKAINEDLPRFLNVYNRVKQCEAEFEAVETNLPQISAKADLSMPVQDELEQWQAALSGTAAGAAAGTAIALAVGGVLPVAGEFVALGGTALALGEFGIAATALGGAVSTVASFTPLGAVVAPAMLISGFAAGMKAEDNREEARAYAAKVDAEVEKVKTQITLCEAVITQSDKLNNVLKEVLALLSGCTQQMEEIVANLPEDEKIRKDSLTEREWQTIAVARSLAGTAKAIVEVPLLTAKKKSVTKKSKQLCEDVEKALPEYTARLQGNNAAN